MKSILDPEFKYTSSVNTDIAKTFARIRREQQRTANAARSAPARSQPANVAAFDRRIRTDGRAA
jgi:hypothetical protein